MSVPGFDSYNKVSQVGQHRVVVTLVRSSLVNDMKQVDMESEDQIWVVLSKWPYLKLGGIYIPPDDSPHYHHAQYGLFARRTLDAGKVVAMGDFNARVGTPIITNTSGNTDEYRGVKDDTINSHGVTLINICNNNNMVVAATCMCMCM